MATTTYMVTITSITVLITNVSIFLTLKEMKSFGAASTLTCAGFPRSPPVEIKKNYVGGAKKLTAECHPNFSV